MVQLDHAITVEMEAGYSSPRISFPISICTKCYAPRSQGVSPLSGIHEHLDGKSHPQTQEYPPHALIRPFSLVQIATGMD
jgi:hypothetical protein